MCSGFRKIANTAPFKGGTINSCVHSPGRPSFLPSQNVPFTVWEGTAPLAAIAMAVRSFMPSGRVQLAHVQEAAERLKAVGALPTPILRSSIIDKSVGCVCHFKGEHLQRTGSFKYRGATNAVGALDAKTAANGVVAHSSGNHGAAVAAAAQARGIPCCIVVPHTTPAAKIENIERYGARVVLCEPTQTARTEASAAQVKAMGATFVHPYDDALVLAGQGTIGLELHEQLGRDELDAVLVPVSGGGLIGGIAVAIKALRPSVRVIAVEPQGKELQLCLAKRQRVIDAATANAPIDTIADAIRTKAFGPTPWASASDLLDPTVLSVSNAQIGEAMRVAFVEMKQVVEPAGALTLAALLAPEFGALRAQGLVHVAAVVCGGNVDLELLMRHVAPRS